MISQQNARKEMFLVVNTIWEARAAVIVGYVPDIRFQGVEEAALPGADKFWARCSTNNVTTRQVGHRMVEDGVSDVVYRTNGFITLQIFAPMKGADSYAKGELLSEIGQVMFMARETAGSVWFRNPRIRELDNDGTWYRWNVLADYEFDQIRDQQGQMLNSFFDSNSLTVAGPNDGLAIVGNELRIDIGSLPTAPNT